MKSGDDPSAARRPPVVMITGASAGLGACAGARARPPEKSESACPDGPPP